MTHNPQSICITGASSGLGAALAKAYAAPGRTVFLLGRNKARLSVVAKICRQQGAHTVEGVIDVRDKEKMAEWLHRQDQEEPIDLLIACAGISAGSGKSGEVEQQVEDIFSTNLWGVLHTIHPILSCMQKRRKGQIAIVSSLASFRGMSTAPAYTASKAAIRFYGEGLRGYYAKDNVGVTVVCPGFIKTPLTAVNPFPMPMMMSAEKAASIIVRRLQHNPARIIFPKVLYIMMRLMLLLPSSWVDALLHRVPNKPTHA